MIIRQETAEDYLATEKVVEEAFRNAEYACHDEHFLVQRLRCTDEFIPELSLVAEESGKIIGHILFSKMWIIGEREYESLSLAPVSVLPDYQNQGIGSVLIRKGLEIAKQMEFESIVVVGHSNYYPRFGFKKASDFKISCSFDVPDEAFMVIELKNDALKGKAGVIKYSEAFGLE